MPRKPRVHFPGAVYHVVVRGNNKEIIYAHEKDKQIYLQKVKSYRKQFFFEILIYAIMDNHAHMVIRVFNNPLSKIMHGIQQSYARYYNQSYKNRGHVFEDHYKAYICDNDRYLLALLRYIHRNPLEAGITENLQYAWSSHRNYCGLKKDGLVNTGFIYGLLTQGTGAEPIISYREFVEAPGQEQKSNFDPSKFVRSVKMDPMVAKEIFDTLLDEVSKAHGIEKSLILSKNVDFPVSQVKKELICKLNHDYQIPRNLIATLMCVDKSYISRVLQSNKSTQVPGT